jgi:hypothetical protein
MQCPPTNPGLKGKKIPFGCRSSQNGLRINLHQIKYFMSSFTKAHNVPLGILYHLGFCYFNRRSQISPCRDHTAVQLID